MKIGSTLCLTYILIAIFVLNSCNQSRQVETADLANGEIAPDDTMQWLYWRCDTVIRRNDSLILMNSRLDTNIIITGALSNLRYDYPMIIPDDFSNLLAKAYAYKEDGNTKVANEYFRKTLQYYHTKRIETLMNFSDLNMVSDYEENACMISSYAYENLDYLDSAILVLKPHLETNKLYGARTLERYNMLQNIKTN